MFSVLVLILLRPQSTVDTHSFLTLCFFSAKLHVCQKKVPESLCRSLCKATRSSLFEEESAFKKFQKSSQIIGPQSTHEDVIFKLFSRLHHLVFGRQGTSSIWPHPSKRPFLPCHFQTSFIISSSSDTKNAETLILLRLGKETCLFQTQGTIVNHCDPAPAHLLTTCKLTKVQSISYVAMSRNPFYAWLNTQSEPFEKPAQGQHEDL